MFWPGEEVDHVLATSIHQRRSPAAIWRSQNVLRLDAKRLRSFLGISHATYIGGRGTLATVDATFSCDPIGDFAVRHDRMSTGKAKSALVLGPSQVGIDNFSFTPPVLAVKAGTEVTWINMDDMPHVIVNTQLKYPPSKVLDTDQRYSRTFPLAEWVRTLPSGK
jgi:plastocyanin